MGVDSWIIPLLGSAEEQFTEGKGFILGVNGINQETFSLKRIKRVGEARPLLLSACLPMVHFSSPPWEKLTVD